MKLTREDILEALESGPIDSAIDMWEASKNWDKLQAEMPTELLPLFRYIIKLNDEGKSRHEIYLLIKDTRIGDDYGN